MSGPHNVLLVDAGNTNVKYCLWQPDGKLSVLSDFNLSVTELMRNELEKILLCSVRQPEFALQLEKVCHSSSIPFIQVFTEPEAFGTRCAYQNYKTLGVDRWMNILAVAQESNEAVLTFSIGTAMTIDLIHERQHIGGWITPGFDLSKHALFENTSGVFGDNDYPKFDAFGESTADCVNFGCRAQVNGLLTAAIQESQKYASKVKVKVFGGGVSLLNKDKFDDLEVDELLVFKGLSRFI